MIAKLLLALLALTVGLTTAAQIFAYTMHLDPALGPPLWRQSGLAIYAPWHIVVWAWRWGQLAPTAFVLPAFLGGLSAGWTVCQCMPTRPKPGQAHWATEPELRHAQCRGKTGIVLGWTGALWWRRLVCYSGPLHCFFVGRTGGGKTNTLTSTLLTYQHSVLLNDPKGELYTRTAGYRATAGSVYRLAPTETTSAGYNFWGGIDPTSAEAFREVELLSHYLLEKEESGPQSSAGAFFSGLAMQFLNGLSLYGLRTGLATCGEDFNDLLTMSDWADLCQRMQEHDLSVVQQAGKLGTTGKGEVHDSLRLTLLRALSVFSDPQVAAMTRATTFPLTALREQDQPCSVYWHVPFRDQARLKRLTRLFFHQVLDYCTQARFLLDQPGRPAVGHPLLWVAEELPSLGYFPMATGGLNYLRGYNIQMLLLTPSMQELLKEFGVHHNFLEGSYVRVIFGLSDSRTAHEFAGSLGTHEVERRRITRQRGRRSTSIDTHDKALLDATGITQLPPGHVLILAGMHALVARQAPFYGYRVWREASTRPVP
jgi:type IV secretion system protein VirD4